MKKVFAGLMALFIFLGLLAACKQIQGEITATNTALPSANPNTSAVTDMVSVQPEPTATAEPLPSPSASIDTEAEEMVMGENVIKLDIPGIGRYSNFDKVPCKEDYLLMVASADESGYYGVPEGSDIAFLFDAKTGECAAQKTFNSGETGKLYMAKAVEKRLYLHVSRLRRQIGLRVQGDKKR